MTLPSLARDFVLAGGVLLLGTAEVMLGWAEESLSNIDFSGVEAASRNSPDPRLFLPVAVGIPLLFLTVIGVSVATWLAREKPTRALLVVWLVVLSQVVIRSDILMVEAAFLYVIFACARWGDVRSRRILLLSLPFLCGLLLFHLRYQLSVNLDFSEGIRAGVAALGAGTWVLPTIGAAAVLMVPWFAGRAAKSSAESRAATEAQFRAELVAESNAAIASEREKKASLARDVHDVVGHSLAVILVQAESAKRDPSAVDMALTNVTETARRALGEIRMVLSETQDSRGRSVGLESTGDRLRKMVKGIRNNGIAVELEEAGSPFPLPPELDTTAYRVLQEALTNAIRHGVETSPILVKIGWFDKLSITVVNRVSVPLSKDGAPADTGDVPPGTGLESMRRRLEAVGGQMLVAGVTDGSCFELSTVVPRRHEGATSGD